MKSRLFNYFVYTGVTAHVLLLLLFLWQPTLLGKLVDFSIKYYYSKMVKVELEQYSGVLNKSIEAQIAATFKPWKPLNNQTSKFQTVAVNGKFFNTLDDALSALKQGDELQFYSGVFTTPFKIDKDNITIVGYGHVVFEKSAYRGKAFIVNKGRDLMVKNIECRFISVIDQNGACIRQEGGGLTLDHVYFHHSESGILENAKQPGNIYISDSRFELLGKSGKAHGVYSNTASLYIQNSLFIASKDEGHAIKNRGKETHITHSLVTSMTSNDSRLIDISNGGKLTVDNSFLHKGLLSVNGQAIGYGLEGIKHKANSISLTNNIILLERLKQNVLLALGKSMTPTIITNNIIISKDDIGKYDGNLYFKNRENAGLSQYPFFPEQLCNMIKPCPLVDYEH